MLCCKKYNVNRTRWRWLLIEWIEKEKKIWVGGLGSLFHDFVQGNKLYFECHGAIETFFRIAMMASQVQGKSNSYK